MAKVTKKGKGNFAKGGTTKMFGEQEAGPQRPGVAAHDVSGKEKAFASGGTTKMFGQGHAIEAPGGVAAKTHNG